MKKLILIGIILNLIATITLGVMFLRLPARQLTQDIIDKLSHDHNLLNAEVVPFLGYNIGLGKLEKPLEK